MDTQQLYTQEFYNETVDRIVEEKIEIGEISDQEDTESLKDELKMRWETNKSKIEGYEKGYAKGGR